MITEFVFKEWVHAECGHRRRQPLLVVAPGDAKKVVIVGHWDCHRRLHDILHDGVGDALV